jgi:hypothetical protein
MEDAYPEFIQEAVAGRYGPPADGGWTAEQVVAHVARTNEDLIATTEAVLAGERPDYDNREVTDAAELDRYAAGYGGMHGLADRVAETVAVLRDLADWMGRRGDVTLKVRIQDGGRTVIDGPVPWSEILAHNSGPHLAMHLAQLRALRVAED